MKRDSIILVVLTVFLLVFFVTESYSVSPYRLRSNWLLPVCVPVEVNSEHVGELFMVGSVEGQKATIFPVNKVPAGEPFVVRPNRDVTIDSLLLDGYTPIENAEYALPWYGGYILTDMDTFIWSYVSEDGDTIAARQLEFQVMRPMDMDFRVNLENPVVRQYMRSVNYGREDNSEVVSYMTAVSERLDIPNPVTIPISAAAGANEAIIAYYNCESPETIQMFGVDTNQELCQLYNLIPGKTYHFKVIADDDIVSQGVFETEGRLRMIYAPSINNIRDIGGWRNTEGRRIKYGKIYRGSELNGLHVADSADVERLLNLGIKAEIDLRYSGENDGAGISAFGFSDGSDFEADEQPSYLFTDNSGCELEHFTYPGVYWQLRWRNEFNYIVDCLRADMPVYQHCVWGADRTGILSMMLEALLGVSYSDIVKDYELTSFCNYQRVKEHFDELIEYFEQFEGTTLQEKVQTYFLNKLHVTQSNIDYFRLEMLEGQPHFIVTGIEQVESGKTVRQGLYDLTGRRLKSPNQGINIMKCKDGSIRLFFSNLAYFSE